MDLKSTGGHQSGSPAVRHNIEAAALDDLDVR
jgi:hypothetical protein